MVWTEGSLNQNWRNEGVSNLVFYAQSTITVISGWRNEGNEAISKEFLLPSATAGIWLSAFWWQEFHNSRSEQSFEQFRLEDEHCIISIIRSQSQRLDFLFSIKKQPPLHTQILQAKWCNNLYKYFHTIIYTVFNTHTHTHIYIYYPPPCTCMHTTTNSSTQFTWWFTFKYGDLHTKIMVI